MAQNLKINILAKDKTRQAFQGVKSSMASLKNTIFSVQGALVGLGGGLAIKSIIGTGRSIEDLQVRLKALFGSTTEGAKAFDVMANFAAKVPFSLEQIQAASGNLAIVAGDANRLGKILEITGNVAAATGLDFQQTAEQIQRSFAGGIAAADVFRERGVRQMLGFSAGATVSAEETIKAFEKVFGKGGKYGQVTDDLATTFTGTLSMLGDKLFNFKRNIAGAQFFDELKKEFSSLNKFIEENSDDFETIAQVIGGALTIAVKTFSIAIRSVANAVGFLRDRYEDLLQLLNKLPFFNFTIIDREQRGILRNLNNYEDKIMKIANEHKSIAGSLTKEKTIREKLSELVKKDLEKLTDISAQSFAILNDGIKGVSQGIAESIVLGKDLGDTFKNLVNTLLVKMIAALVEVGLKIALQVALENTALATLFAKLRVEKAITDEKNEQNKATARGQKQSILGSILNIGASFLPFDKGGAVSKGKPIVVGERGAELFIPNQTGQITQSARGTNGGAVNVNFTINTVDASGFEDLLVRSRGTISQLINQAVNERGQGNLI